MSNNEKDGAIAMIVLGAVGVYRGVSHMLLTRKVEDSSTTPIGTAPQGQIEIQGYIWPAEKMHQNMSGRRCCYSKIELQRYVRRNKKSYWQTVWTQVVSAPFYVFDRSGAVRINPLQVEMNGSKKTASWGIVRSAYKAWLKETYGNSLSLPGSGFFSGRHRLVEESITIGSPAYVNGHYETRKNYPKDVESSAALAFADEVKKLPERLSETSVRFDLDKNGKTTAVEAHKALHLRAKLILEKNGEESKSYTLGTGYKINGEMFSTDSVKTIVYDMHEAHLLKKIKNWNLLFVVGGAGMVSTGLFWLFN